MSRKSHPQSRGMKRNKKRVAHKVRVSTPVRQNTPRTTMTVEIKQKKSKPLTWKNDKKGTCGKFVALYEEMLNDVPNELSAPPAERIATFHRVRKALAHAKNNVANTGAVIFDIQWTMLDFPKEGVGREKRVDRGHVGHIVQNYNASSWAVPVVAMRPIYDDAGNLINALFEITDGMHRRCIALERAYASCPDALRTDKNPVKISVSVSEVSSVRETAQSFADQNGGGRLRMRGTDDWRNMYLAGLKSVVDTVNLAAEYGLDASAPVNKRGWPRCQGKIIMHMCNVDFNGGPYHFPWLKEEDVRYALRLITDPACTGVYKNTNAVNKQNFFGGLCHFLAYYARPGYAHYIGLRHLLSRPEIVERAIEIGKEYSEGLIRLEMPHVTEAMLSRDETSRYHQIAAALRRLYVTKVPAPKTRSTSDGWAECPADLRRLFHLAPAIVDDEERKRFISDIHAKLNALDKKNRAKTPKSLVR